MTLGTILTIQFFGCTMTTAEGDDNNSQTTTVTETASKPVPQQDKQQMTTCKQVSKFLLSNQSGLIIPKDFQEYIYGTDCIQINNSYQQWYDVRDIDGNIMKLDWLQVVKKENNVAYYAIDVSKVSEIPNIAQALKNNGYVPFTLIQGCDSGERFDKEYYIVSDIHKACTALNKSP